MASAPSVSVCTIVRDRDTHLYNLVRGLAQQTQVPGELVIGYMQPHPAPELQQAPFPIRGVHIAGERLPLAAARNRAAEAAAGDLLVFLDVDCIPGPRLIAAYAATFADLGGCLMGPTRYLAEGAVRQCWTFPALWQEATPHPARMDPESEMALTVSVADFSELWGLSFALSRQDFREAGGFDERFQGYGAEETDFARALAAAGLTLCWVRTAQAVHQWHPVHVPPLQHFDDIVRNAALFHDKHGAWPMGFWLDHFERAGLIERAERIQVLRRPTRAEIEAARQPGSVLFS